MDLNALIALLNVLGPNVSLREKGVDLNSRMISPAIIGMVSLREKGVDLNISKFAIFPAS